MTTSPNFSFANFLPFRLLPAGATNDVSIGAAHRTTELRRLTVAKHQQSDEGRQDHARHELQASASTEGTTATVRSGPSPDRGRRARDQWPPPAGSASSQVTRVFSPPRYRMTRLIGALPWSENIVSGSLRRPSHLFSDTTAIPSCAAAPLRLQGATGRTRWV